MDLLSLLELHDFLGFAGYAFCRPCSVWLILGFYYCDYFRISFCMGSAFLAYFVVPVLFACGRDKYFFSFFLLRACGSFFPAPERASFSLFLLGAAYFC